ncbi:MAG: hypothetical protein WCE94_00355 [Candidatus Methanoperedens sp.]
MFQYIEECTANVIRDCAPKPDLILLEIAYQLGRIADKLEVAQKPPVFITLPEDPTEDQYTAMVDKLKGILKDTVDQHDRT